MTIRLIGKAENCSCVQKTLIVAEYVQCKLQIEEPKDDQPIKLITEKGFELTDSVSALRYLARMKPNLLYGYSPDEMAAIDSWMEYGQNKITVPIFGMLAWNTCDGQGIERIKADIRNILKEKLEPHLLHNTFLVGERLSIADINLALNFSCATRVDANMFKDFPNIQRWFRTILEQPEVKKHLGSGKTDKKEVKKEAKKEAPKAQAKPEAGKEKSAADIEDEIEAEEKARAKKPNPLDSLPPTPLVLDAWKREYSNTKDLRGVAMPWFWTNYDPAGWSLWFMRYDKEEGENSVGFIAGNMLRGFIQRLDPNFRKYSFGVVNVLGATGGFEIQGVWMFRGHEIPFEVKDHPSFEYHTFRKLDPAADKALIESYWCENDAIEGQPIESCQVWK